MAKKAGAKFPTRKSGPRSETIKSAMKRHPKVWTKSFAQNIDRPPSLKKVTRERMEEEKARELGKRGGKFPKRRGRGTSKGVGLKAISEMRNRKKK